MDKSLLKRAAIQSVALMLVVITTSYALKQYQTITIAASNIIKDEYELNKLPTYEDMGMLGMVQLYNPGLTRQESKEQETQETESYVTGILEYGIERSVYSQLSDNYLAIKKPQGNNISMELHDIYINKSIQLLISGMKDYSMTSDMINRIRGEKVFNGDPEFTEVTRQELEKDGTTKEVSTKYYNNDISHGIVITTDQDSATGLYTAQILIELDNVYAYILYEDENYFYINLKKPSEVYDKILVIDAGHGGKDAGALSKGEQYYEKNINLDIVLHLKELLKQEDIKVYYTRTADDKVFLRPRVELANAVDSDYFISVHCNANDVTQPNGTEILYYNTNFKGVSANKLATIFSEEISKTALLEVRGIIERRNNEIFIMDKSLIPTVLIEVGYLTNNYDMDYLSETTNRQAVAQGIYNGIMRAYNELPATRAANN